MAIVSRTQLKAWFRIGLKPLEAQFASWIDSFWHKNDAIPMSSVEGLNDALNRRTISIDDALSDSSTNPLQNKIVKAALDGKAPILHRHEFSEIDGYIPPTYDDELDANSENAVKNSVVTGELNNKAPVNHNHDSVYAPLGHNHDGVYQPAGNYAPANHNHDAAYAPLGHNHDGVYQPAGSYAPANHNHDAAYAPLGHNHDGVYQPVGNYLTQHQDISDKQDKTDNSLLTTVKTIAGAINELWNKFADYLKGIQHVTYAQLVTLKNNSGLVAGQWYRITDYMTTVANDTEARSAGHPFDLLVMATSANTLSEEAKAVKSSRDSNDYFADANLNAWKVWYCLDNDPTRFQWADTENGKGVIWRMIDEWQNDCPYDFKNVQYKRYKATALSEVLEEAIDGQYYAYNGDMMNVEIEDEEDFVWAYTFTLIDENEDWVDYSIKKDGALDPEADFGYLQQFKKGRCEYNSIRHCYTAVTVDEECYRTLMLNNIVLIATIDDEYGLSGEMQLNEFGSGNYNMTVKDNPEKNIFGNKCYNNIVGSYGNTFGNGCYRNTFGNYFQCNTFGNGCSDNTFGNSFQYNTFGNGCGGNTFGNGCSWNTFGNGCWYNTFGNDCYNNTFGNGCSWNTFGNNCYYNTFGNDCCYNTFGNGCSWNTFGNDCYENTFGNYCYSNTFGNNVHDNTFGNNCRYITVHNGVQYVEVPGGSTVSAYVQNAQILNGTHGTDSSNLLQISFQEDADYCQFAGLNSSGILKIWVPADAA
ncbi:MAG: hypothetical protein IJQ32_03490 [Paludibacteraceae bacterium]|nr:hypothetical protein [Paludibacteraceae bacterium]